jgi:AICAR transformylase/IMP cyclohydrolase PurH
VCYAPPQGLAAAGYELVSTGGSAKAIEAAGVAVKKVEDLTGFPEMLDGEFYVLHVTFIVTCYVTCLAFGNVTKYMMM